MITQVTIERFKCVRRVQFAARRVNLFMGWPASGKSSLLQALGMLNPLIFGKQGWLFGVEDSLDLYANRDSSEPILVSGAGMSTLRIYRQGDRAEARLVPEGGAGDVFFMDSASLGSGENLSISGRAPSNSPKYYRYREFESGEWSRGASTALMEPDGENLPDLIAVHEPLRRSVSALLQASGLRLEFSGGNAKGLLIRPVGGKSYPLAFEAISKTLRQAIFYSAVMITHANSVLILDDIATQIHPGYAKFFGEQIARSKDNQFFLATQNPYVFTAILEKTPSQDLAVYVTRLHHGQTELHLFTDDECEEALDLGMDVLSNLHRYFQG